MGSEMCIRDSIIADDNRQPRHDTRFKLFPLSRPRTSPLCMGVLYSPTLLMRYRSSPERLRVHGTTAALQALPFVTATNGAFACVCAGVRVCMSSYSRILALQRYKKHEQSVSTREVQLQLFFSHFLFPATIPAASCITPYAFGAAATHGTAE